MTSALPSYQELRTQTQARTIEQLQTELHRLRAELEAATAAGKRQAAPFRKGPPKPDPKTPGRKAGEQHGTHGHRPTPPPD